MKILLPLAIGSVLLAQTNVIPGVPANWENLTAQAVLAFIVIWLVTRTLPAWQNQFVSLNETFAKSMAVSVTAIENALGTVDSSQKLFINGQKDLELERAVHWDKMRETLDKLALNCAVVHSKLSEKRTNA